MCVCGGGSVPYSTKSRTLSRGGCHSVDDALYLSRHYALVLTVCQRDNTQRYGKLILVVLGDGYHGVHSLDNSIILFGETKYYLTCRNGEKNG